MIARCGLGRSTQWNPRSSKTFSRPRKASADCGATFATGQPSMASAPSRRASSTAARITAYVIPWPRCSARTNRQGSSQTLSSSARARLPISVLRLSVATTYRDRGPHAHQPTGSPAIEARIPIGVEFIVALASKRRRLPPPNQPVANWLRVTQNAMHQQWRVALCPSNSRARCASSPGPTGRVSTAAPTSGGYRDIIAALDDQRGWAIRQDQVGERTQAGDRAASNPDRGNAGCPTA